MWRFVAGLTKFSHFGPLDECDAKAEIDKTAVLTKFFIECLFEAQTMEYCNFINTSFAEQVTAVASWLLFI